MRRPQLQCRCLRCISIHVVSPVHGGLITSYFTASREKDPPTNRPNRNVCEENTPFAVTLSTGFVATLYISAIMRQCIRVAAHIAMANWRGLGTYSARKEAYRYGRQVACAQRALLIQTTVI